MGVKFLQVSKHHLGLVHVSLGIRLPSVVLASRPVAFQDLLI